MALAAVGLQTHIWNNQIKSVLLLLGFPVLLLLLVATFFAMMPAHPETSPVEAGVSGVLRYGHWVILAAIAWFVIAWFSHTSMINAASGAREISRRDNPELYNMLENLCISRGMPTPKLQIMETPMLNAFASGIDDKSYRVSLTRGLIEALEPDELEAVMAHELSHIRHKDVRLLIIAVIFAGIITFAAEMMFRSMLYGGAGRKRDGRVMLIAFAVMAVAYLLAIGIRFALSRRREYLADAGAVELTKNPDAMISALQKISGRSDIKGMPDDIQQMMVENRTGFLGVFATHPPIEKRIEALKMLGGRDNTLSSHEEPMQAPRADARRPMPWSRRHGPWG